jgi:pimeloyl-ACP methyl ester carboxylesterase
VWNAEAHTKAKANLTGNGYPVAFLSTPSTAQPSRISLETGGVLDFAAFGPKDGTPVVFHHGTPGSLILFEPFLEAAAERGLRYVSYSRPGYGNSRRQPGRTVADCAKDTASILDRLGADRFYVIGWSGGGPHALGCAALLPQRVVAASTIAAVAPWGSQNLDWLAGMGKENIEEFRAALAGPDELRSYLEREGLGFARVTGDQIIEAFGDLVDDVDKSALSSQLGAFLADNIHEALRNGFWGWFDDDIAFINDWGFDLSRIKVPVTVWQGAKDRMVPFAHGRWLAEHLPGARAHLLPEHGHLSLAVGSFAEILDDLIASGKR